MRSVEITHKNRLTLIRQTLDQFISLESAHMPTLTTSTSNLRVLLETLNIDREISVMIERDKTGNARIDPFLYIPQTIRLSSAQNKTPISSTTPNNTTAPNIHNNSSASIKSPTSSLLSPRWGLASVASEQVFGVPLEDASAHCGRKVPTLMRKTLRAIVKNSIASGLKPGQEIDYWCVFAYLRRQRMKTTDRICVCVGSNQICIFQRSSLFDLRLTIAVNLLPLPC
jgi:hypothetical protein